MLARITLVSCVVSLMCSDMRAAEDPVAKWIAEIRQVGREASGSPAARAARDNLARRGPEILPHLLEGMNTSDVVAANWLRSVFEEIVDRAIETNRDAISREQLRRCVTDATIPGRVRRLALAVLDRLDSSIGAQLIPTMLDDPEFRSDAVAVAIQTGDRHASLNQLTDAVAVYTRAFDAARNADHIKQLATRLRSHGQVANITRHMGFIDEWYLVGPFDGPDFAAYTKRYPPEREINLKARYDGQRGPIGWMLHRTPDEFGSVDLVKTLGAADGAAAYALTSINSTEERCAEVRCGADDNLTIWLNGIRVFGKEEWQNGTRLDRFITPIQLKAGRNDLLVKICQGPKYRDPGMANLWSLQVRICDATGRGIPFDVTPTTIDSTRTATPGDSNRSSKQ